MKASRFAVLATILAAVASLMEGCTSGSYATSLNLTENVGGLGSLSADTNTCAKCAGDPISFSTGNAYLEEVDYKSATASPIVLERHYNSQDTTTINSLGFNWHAPYSRSVALASSTAAKVTRDDGRIFPFTLINGVWTAPANVNSRLMQTSTGWTYTTGLDEIETYSAAGKLLTYAHRAGLALTMGYDAGGNLATVTDAFGRTLRFSYNAATAACPIAGLAATCPTVLTSATDPAGRKYAYAYDKLGNLASVTFPDGSQRQYVYENSSLPHALTGVIDENGNRYTTFTYTTQSTQQGTLILATSTEHAGGADLYKIDYSNAAGGAISVTLPLGGFNSYSMQAIDGLPYQSTESLSCATCTSGSNGQTSNTFDANGNALTTSDFNSNLTRYTYDVTRNLPTSVTDPIGNVTRLAWNPSFRLPATITEPNRTTNLGYDAHGNLLQASVTATTGTRTWGYTYNAGGQVLTATGPRTDLAQVTHLAYDGQGNLTTITNALGQVWQVTNTDANGRPLSIQDPNGLITTLSWNFRGQITFRNVGGELTQYAYDAVGDLLKVTFPDDSFLSFSYDAAHRLTGVADALGNHASFTLDAAGNATAEQLYDAGSNLVRTHTRTYDGLNRLIADMGAGKQTTNLSYDANNNLTGITDPLGNRTTFSLDQLNRISEIFDPSASTNFTYDTNNRLTGVAKEFSYVPTSYTWDGLDNQTATVSTNTGATNRTFDAAGNVLSAVDAEGRLANYTYDALDRITQIHYAGTAPTMLSYDRGANGIGHLTSMDDASGNTTWSYDEHGRVSTKTQEVGTQVTKVQYAYDAAGHLISTTYPSGAVVTYSYTAGRVSGIMLNGHPLLSAITYQPLYGAVQAWSWGNGAGYQRTFDQDGRISSYPLGGRTRQIVYDAASRITAYTDSDVARNQSFAYDNVSRLTQYTAQGGSERYGYDLNGNRTSLSTTFPSAKSVTYNTAIFGMPSSDRILSIRTGNTTTPYAYDNTGNAINDGANQFTYDGRNRLTQVSNAEGLSYYAINGLGQRVAKLSGAPPDLAGDANHDGVLNTADLRLMALMIQHAIPVDLSADCNHDGQITAADVACVQAKIANMRLHPQQYVTLGTVFVYDEANHLIGEYANGRALEETVYLGDTPLAVLKGGTAYYVFTDQLNAPRVITNNAGVIVWDWEGSPFGDTPANQDPAGTGLEFVYNLRFPGQYYDQETGLHYNTFRDYNPKIGRYLQSDPIGLAGGVNNYAYVGSMPLDFVDPLGLCSSEPLPVNGQMVNWGQLGLCFLKGVGTGIGVAVVVGGGVAAAAFLGVPAAVVTGALGVAALIGGGIALWDTFNDVAHGNWASVAFTVGTLVGGAGVGFGGGRAVARTIDPNASPGWNLARDLNNRYIPSKGPVGPWLATGPDTGAAGGSLAVSGSGGSLVSAALGCP